MPGDQAILKGVPAALSAADHLNNFAVKFPLFWPENIETWFVQAESQFRLRAVTIRQTKFDYCIQAMPQEVTVKVLNLIRNPPTENLHQHLMDRLLQMYILNNYSDSSRRFIVNSGASVSVFFWLHLHSPALVYIWLQLTVLL